MRKHNILFKHAVLTKLALIAGLLFISLWLWYLDGETLTTRDGMELPRQAIRIEESVACLPSRVASPVSLSKQKECFSMAELYVRLLWEDQKWVEPTEKDLGSHVMPMVIFKRRGQATQNDLTE